MGAGRVAVEELEHAHVVERHPWKRRAAVEGQPVPVIVQVETRPQAAQAEETGEKAQHEPDPAVPEQPRAGRGETS